MWEWDIECVCSSVSGWVVCVCVCVCVCVHDLWISFARLELILLKNKCLINIIIIINCMEVDKSVISYTCTDWFLSHCIHIDRSNPQLFYTHIQIDFTVFLYTCMGWVVLYTCTDPLLSHSIAIYHLTLQSHMYRSTLSSCKMDSLVKLYTCAHQLLSYPEHICRWTAQSFRTHV